MQATHRRYGEEMAGWAANALRAHRADVARETRSFNIVDWPFFCGARHGYGFGDWKVSVKSYYFEL